jgi:hypothetical protein
MDITPNTRTVTEYHLTLTSDEALACIDKPWDFGEALAEKLRAAGLGAPVATNGNGSGNGHQKNRVHLTLGRKGASRKAGRKAKAAPKAGNHRPAKHACHACTKTFTSLGYLARHVAKAHTAKPEPTTWQTAASQTAPAAAAE